MRLRNDPELHIIHCDTDWDRQDLYDGGNTQEPQLINCVRIFEGYRSKYVPKSKYLHKVFEVENLELTDRASPISEWSYESEFEKLFSYPLSHHISHVSRFRVKSCQHWL